MVKTSAAGGLSSLHRLSEKELLKAFLVSVYKGGPSQKRTYEEHLQELALLAETYGLQVEHQATCAIRSYEASTYVTAGKLEELVTAAKTHHVDVVVFDDEIAPGQQRNLEKAFGIPVIDRTELILAVFAQRAQTKEAKLQIELAQIKYEAPRLKRLWTHLSRQSGTAGASGYTKGEGEKQIEIDRRILKRKIDQLQQEIKEVKAHRATQRMSRQRTQIPVFALIGYTNVGKSTLLNALTHAGVFVEDKLFATLDTTTRKFTMVNGQEILLIDTVGFIRKLPHLLVAAFKSTLEEAFQSDVLIHLVDASHPMAEEQAETTFEVLKELNVASIPIVTVFNKVDLCCDKEVLDRLKQKYPGSVGISALNQQGLDELQSAMIEVLSKRRKLLNLRIPQADYALVSELARIGHVIKQDYEGNDVLLQIELPAGASERMKKYVYEA